ncbi:MAG: hypothetical protein AVDCRST_MAG49-2128 [uncultured Thermomicrobiales bacterium]|uniref:Uncharacterized protein n=1 Tax=uncultured Thermomicrobiales bacterium TaxID=1645740 RepID=A0A6J4UPR1_9BACT|nr:MAG: hypothetical protein AVDCRST_MAG49-2128 [uncultured Thermomicrobiales bacterium]
MRYDVTYQVGGEERTDHIDAPDAASAVAQVQEAHGRTAELFELISVNLLDEMPDNLSDGGESARQRADSPG